MRTSSIAALSAVTIAVSAIPMVKRDIVWVTEVDIDTVIIPVTKTVWVDYPGASAVEAVVSHSKHHHGHLTSTVTITPTSTIVAVSSATPAESTSTPVAVESTSTQVAVAPTTTSTSAYVAPTTSVYVAPTTSTTSSVYVAPTTSVYVAPTTSAYVPPTTTSSAASTSSTPSSSGSVNTGDLTYYAIGLGSCGMTNTDSEAVVALAHGMMTANWPGNPNDNPLCNKQVSITYGGVTKTATIVDTCEGCDGASLDLSDTLFADFADLGVGRLTGATWTFT